MKIEGHENLMRAGSGVIINTDESALQRARLAKSTILQEKQKVYSLEERVSHLEELIKRLTSDSQEE